MGLTDGGRCDIIKRKEIRGSLSFSDFGKGGVTVTFEKLREWTFRYFGKTMKIRIDCPMGSVRHTKRGLIKFPVNYGHLLRKSGEGRPIGVYLLGVDHPVKEFEGQIIGIAHRTSGWGDSLIAVPKGTVMHQGQISEAIAFREKYHKTQVEGFYQRSCGVILFRRRPEGPEYLILHQAAAGGWSFPKGHMEAGETEERTARRETVEEAGIRSFSLLNFRKEVRYTVGGMIEKTVVFFAAETDSEPRLRNRKEIDGFEFASLERAKRLLHPDYGRLLDELDAKLKK